MLAIVRPAPHDQIARDQYEVRLLSADRVEHILQCITPARIGIIDIVVHQVGNADEFPRLSGILVVRSANGIGSDDRQEQAQQSHE